MEIPALGRRGYDPDAHYDYAYLIECTIACYNDRHWFEDANTNTSKTSNDHLILPICKSLNASAWSKLQNCNEDENNETILKFQLKSVSQINEQLVQLYGCLQRY